MHFLIQPFARRWSSSSILYDCSKVLLRGNVSYYGLSHQQSASHLLNFKGHFKMLCSSLHFFLFKFLLRAFGQHISHLWASDNKILDSNALKCLLIGCPPTQMEYMILSEVLGPCFALLFWLPKSSFWLTTYSITYSVVNKCLLK